MKTYKKILISFFIFGSFAFSLIGNELNDSLSESSTITEQLPFNDLTNPILLDEKTGFPLILKKPFPVFDYGPTTSIVTRITTQEKRSNFVEDHYFLGLYAAMQSRNMEPLDSMIRIALYYPVAYKFNNVPIAMKNMLNFGIDLFAAPYINLSLWHYLTFDLGGGLHFFYEQGDDYNLVNLGIGAFARINMPVSRRWSLFVDGYFSIDYGNFGTNSKMAPYNYVWQYQVAVGVRYSKKSPNKYSYIPSKRTYDEDIQMLANKEIEKKVKKEEKKAEAEAKKALKAEQKRLEEEQKALEKEAAELEQKSSEDNLNVIDAVFEEDVESFDELQN